MKLKNTINKLILSTLLLTSCNSFYFSRYNIISRNLEKRINNEETKKNNKKDTYVVMIAGEIILRETLSLTCCYNFFIRNNFDRNNIYILDEEGKEKIFYNSSGQATKKNIEFLLSHLAKKIDEKDLLFIYIMDHGVREEENLPYFETVKTEVSSMVLQGKNMSETGLKKYLDKINSKVTIVLADICYGGGFAKRFSSKNYIGISSSEEKEMSHGSIDHTFGRYFIGAHNDLENSDLNKDKKVSIFEAFEYARKNHEWTKNGEDIPLLKSELNLNNVFLK